MNILLVSKRLGGSTCLCLNRGRIIALAVAVLLAIPSIAMYAGYRLGHQQTPLDSSTLSVRVNSELERQRNEIVTAKQTAEDNLNALTLRLGQMQAHVARLDALGQRLTRIAGLDSGEFDFGSEPAQGGPEGDDLSTADSVAMPDFMTQLEELSDQLESREQQLSLLENMIMNHNLQAAVLPAGRPIAKGWISSRYGMRTDPFNGKPEFHKGLDLAGKEGTHIVAVAAGVVTWAGKRYGYGNLVEINHGKGYVTRYGHARKVLVKVGDTVKKGQVIAEMGNTGRSTGPHVHFEVWRNGHTVDPMKYVQASSG